MKFSDFILLFVLFLCTNNRENFPFSLFFLAVALFLFLSLINSTTLANIQPPFEHTNKKRNEQRTRERPYRTNEHEETENEMNL